MSHAETWDDSALVDSWNEALEEYKHYHSLHARGEKVEAVLKSHDQHTGPTVAGSTLSGSKEELAYEMMADGDEAGLDTTGMHGSTLNSENVDHSPPDQASPIPPHTSSTNGAPPLPQHLIGSVGDDGLKNLLMSWYYAGYYTGLHEGKNHVTQGGV